MNKREYIEINLDAEGRLVLPGVLAKELGVSPGQTLRLERLENGYRIRRPVGQLAKVYVEPTSHCNLVCRTCIRNSWEEPLGDMTWETFERVVQGLRQFDPLPEVFFGGFGEPLFHPRIVEMVTAVKAIGVPRVQLITNGCLLDREMSAALIRSGLDDLWVSLDGITPESYSDVRLGAELPHILENLEHFREVREELQLGPLPAAQRELRQRPARAWSGHRDLWALPQLRPRLGIVFVAMRRNLADLPEVIRQGRDLGAVQFLVSNVLPYTKEMVGEMLYEELLGISPVPTFWSDQVKVALLPVNDFTRKPLWLATCAYDWPLASTDVSGITRCCPFVEQGSLTIAWDGSVSPCLALMHTHSEYFRGQERAVRRYEVGSLDHHSLRQVWEEPDYVAFRQRVQEFDFAPCIACGGCDMTASNEEDCEDNIFPRCGACLWGHGLIRCP